jgi:hypothetical protein
MNSFSVVSNIALAHQNNILPLYDRALELNGEKKILINNY